MEEIEIHDLTLVQAAFTIVLYSCTTKGEYDRFIEALPTDALKRDAQYVLDQTIASTIDESIANNGISDNTQSLINRIKEQ